MSEQERYFQGVLNDDREVLNEIYEEYFPTISSFVLKNKGGEDDCWDIFQDSVMAVYFKAQDPDFVLKNTFGGYFYGIARNLWRKKLSKNSNKEVTLDEAPELSIEDGIESAIFLGEQYQFFRDHFERLTDRCKKIMELFFEKNKMAQIAVAMGFKNAEVAKKEKSKCQKRLIEAIKNDPNYDAYL